MFQTAFGRPLLGLIVLAHQIRSSVSEMFSFPLIICLLLNEGYGSFGIAITKVLMKPSCIEELVAREGGLITTHLIHV